MTTGEVIALIKAFGGSGGGSSGGGVLVVHATISDAGITLDKTWQEIYDADYAVAYIGVGINGRAYGQLINIDYNGEEYSVSFVTISNIQTTDVLTLTATSPSDYPSYTE